MIHLDLSSLLALFLQDVPPPDAPTLIGVVGLPAAIGLAGLILFGVLYRASIANNRSYLLRHVGTLMIAAALVVSLRTMLKLYDAETGKIYAAAILRPHTLYAHYAMPAFLGMILVGIGIAEGYLNKALPGSR